MGGQLGILQHWCLGQKCNHTYMSSYGETQKPDSMVFGMCSCRLIAVNFQVRCSQTFLRKLLEPLNLSFKIKLTDNAGVLQIASHNGIHGTFKMCVVTL
jgi:hypothetical protein